MREKPILMLIMGLLLIGLLGGCDTPEATPDPHAGMIEVRDGMGGTMWVPDQESVAVNSYHGRDFTTDGNYVNYIGEGVKAIQGIDVSYYQGEIDWAAVRRAGISFAILRAGYRGWGEDGTLKADERFAQNLAGAKAAGLEVGVYFFSQAVTPEEAAQEAEYALSLIDGAELELPVYFDWEHISMEQEARTNAVALDTLTDLCLAFIEPIRSAGYQPGLYFYRSLGYFAYDFSRLEGVDFWLAAVGEEPAFYYAFDMWQYSYTATVPGISAAVDLDLRFMPVEPPVFSESPAETE